LNKWPATTGMVVCLSIGVVMQALYRLGYKSTIILNTGLLFGLGINWFLGTLVAEHRTWLLRGRGVCEIAGCWPLVLALSIGLWCSQRFHLEFVFASSGVAFTLMLIRFLAEDAKRGGGPDDLTARERSFVTILGLSSYPTYLFHGPILMLAGW